jgi:hypothetical protein
VKLTRPVLPLLVIVLAACSDNSGNGAASGLADTRPALELTYSEPPIDLPGIAADCALDVRYGEAERDLLDLCLPDSDQPTPLVIFFHGGAYIQGDKSDAYAVFPADIRQFLQAGIAFATISYPFISIESPFDDEGVIKPLTHSARALQFLRYHAGSLNIDPAQVASYGVSAGASTSLWLGTHDDLADPDNRDPVLRESSRLQAVGAIYTQSTLNFLRWEEILAPVVAPLAPQFGGSDILTVATYLGAGPLLFGATGTDSVEELQSPELLPYMQNIDALGNMDAGDAPIYAMNDNAVFKGDWLNLFLHHTLHVIALHDRAQEVGLENVMYARDPVYFLEDPSGEDRVSFLIRHFR